jgi:hypothetical protein
MSSDNVTPRQEDKVPIWVVKHYYQTENTEPKVDETEEFKTEAEALEFYRRMKRSAGWPWRFWAFPERVER